MRVAFLLLLVACSTAPSPAHHDPATQRDGDAAATSTFRRGVIVNHWLGYNMPNAEYGAPWFDRDDVAWIADRGFDHVRIWVNGAAWIDERGRLDDTKVGRFDELLRWTGERRLGLVLAMHGLPGYRTSSADAAWPFGDAAIRAGAASLWSLVAERYAGVGDRLRFELLLAPKGAPNAEELRQLQAEMLDGIRRVDRARVVYLTPRDGSIDHAADVVLSDPNTALSITFIEPEIFTFQFGQPRQLKVTFPGKVPELVGLPADAVLDPAWTAKYARTELTEATLSDAVEKLASEAHRQAQHHEVYVSRIGVMRGVDDVSAKTYLRTLRNALDRAGLGWAVYDYHTGGAVRDELGTGAATRIVDGLAPSRS